MSRDNHMRIVREREKRREKQKVNVVNKVAPHLQQTFHKLSQNPLIAVWITLTTVIQYLLAHFRPDISLLC